MFDTSTWSPIMKLALTAGALWLVWKHGPDWARGLAMGAAGYVAIRQIPIVRDGADVRLIA